MTAFLVDHPQVAAADRLDPGPPRRLVELDQRKQIRQIGHRHRRHARLAQACNQRIDGHQPVADGKLGMQAKMDEGLRWFLVRHG